MIVDSAGSVMTTYDWETTVQSAARFNDDAFLSGFAWLLRGGTNPAGPRCGQARDDIDQGASVLLTQRAIPAGQRVLNTPATSGRLAN
jgi:hypothetical protein